MDLTVGKTYLVNIGGIEENWKEMIYEGKKKITPAPASHHFKFPGNVTDSETGYNCHGTNDMKEIREFKIGKK